MARPAARNVFFFPSDNNQASVVSSRMLDLDYPALLGLFPQYRDPKRSESASFLIWYLENYYRFDPQESVDSVCDQSGDKGVDGIVVNDNDQTITILQSRISQSRDATIGDASLRAFAGTLTQFETPETIDNLIRTAGKAQVGPLAKRLDLTTKIATYELRGEFVSNIELDANGTAFLATHPTITFVGKSRLQTTYISDARDIVEHPEVTFDIVGFPVTEYIVDANVKAIIAPVKATELVGLSGIADQSLFAYNVRGSLGSTGVNRDIAKSINEPARHKLFPLFHNGITVIARRLERDNANLKATGCFVVNGCQSLTALYSNRGRLTDNLRVLTKFIQLDPASPLAKQITEFSNNQNGVKARDFMANNRIQIRLQNEFKERYDGEYVFDIKRGEPLAYGKAISNEDAGLFLMAFDLKEPWATHRKYQVFEDKHSELFGRPEVTADRIVLCQTIMEIISDALPKLHNSLFAKYVLTRYFLIYVVRQILETDALATEIFTKPERFVRDPADRDRFRRCISTFVDDVIIDVNAEVDGYGEDFDYRDKLRDAEWVKKLATTIVADHQKQVNRGRTNSFAKEWESPPPDTVSH